MKGKRREKSSRLWWPCELRLHPPYCAPPTLLGEEQLHTSPPTVQLHPENTVKYNLLVQELRDGKESSRLANEAESWYIVEVYVIDITAWQIRGQLKDTRACIGVMDVLLQGKVK